MVKYSVKVGKVSKENIIKVFNMTVKVNKGQK
jgi:hypothetical protein